MASRRRPRRILRLGQVLALGLLLLAGLPDAAASCYGASAADLSLLGEDAGQRTDRPRCEEERRG